MEFDRSHTMYLWRKLTPEQRAEVLQWRRSEKRPWHSIPHYTSDDGLYLITAACYEHRHHLRTLERMAAFSRSMLETVAAAHVDAWVVLPNHYHVLLQTPDVKGLLKGLGKLHGRTSFAWNREEQCRGRHVWCNAAETAIKSEGHFYAALNYVLNNAVRHGYVTRWQDWPFSNAAAYLDAVGREEATRRWRLYPLLGFGDTWDPPGL